MKKRTLMIIIAVFSMSVLAMFDNIVKPSYAQIVTSSDINAGGQNNKLFSMEAMSLFVSVSSASGANQNAMSYFRSDEVNPTVRTVQIQPYVGGCNAVDNPCGTSSSGLPLFSPINTANEVNWVGHAQGLWCGLTDCFTYWISTNSSYPHQLQRYVIETPSGTFSLNGYMNITFATVLREAIAGYDSNTGGIGGVTLFTIRNNLLFRTGATGLMQDVGSTSFAGVSAVVNSMQACNVVVADMPNCPTGGRVALAWRDGASSFFRIFTGTGTSVCTSASLGTMTSDNLMVAYNTDSNRWYVTEADASSSLLTFASDSCTSSTVTGVTISSFSSGLVFDDPNNTNPDIFYLYHGSTASAPSTTKYQLDTATSASLSNFDSTVGSTITGWISGANAPTQAIAINNNAHSLVVSGDTSAIRIIYLTDFTPTPQPGGSGIDCSLPENFNILTCRLQNQNGTLASFEDLVGQTFGNATNNIFVQLGLVPAGSDIQTNGVGYGLTLVGLGIMISMFALGSGMELNRIPTFVWFLGTLAVMGISTGFGFIEPLWLIISILVIIALASAKILSSLEIGGFR